jgi:ATP-dependent DNA ligase
VREPFDHPDYIFELKHDGFRAIAYLRNGESKLVSRNQRNLGFEALKRAESQKEGIDMPQPSIEQHAVVARLERVEKENRRPRSKPA